MIKTNGTWPEPILQLQMGLRKACCLTHSALKSPPSDHSWLSQTPSSLTCSLPLGSSDSHVEQLVVDKLFSWTCSSPPTPVERFLHFRGGIKSGPLTAPGPCVVGILAKMRLPKPFEQHVLSPPKKNKQLGTCPCWWMSFPFKPTTGPPGGTPKATKRMEKTTRAKWRVVLKGKPTEHLLFPGGPIPKKGPTLVRPLTHTVFPDAPNSKDFIPLHKSKQGASYNSRCLC